MLLGSYIYPVDNVEVCPQVLGKQAEISVQKTNYCHHANYSNICPFNIWDDSSAEEVKRELFNEGGFCKDSSLCKNKICWIILSFFFFGVWQI